MSCVKQNKEKQGPKTSMKMASYIEYVEKKKNQNIRSAHPDI